MTPVGKELLCKEIYLGKGSLHQKRDITVEQEETFFIVLLMLLGFHDWGTQSEILDKLKKKIIVKQEIQEVFSGQERPSALNYQSLGGCIFQ